MQMNIAEKIDKEAFNVICTELKNIKISYSTKCYYFTFYIHNSKGYCSHKIISVQFSLPN